MKKENQRKDSLAVSSQGQRIQIFDNLYLCFMSIKILKQRGYTNENKIGWAFKEEENGKRTFTSCEWVIGLGYPISRSIF